MRAVIGLGNPGKKYELTRHNIGFLILNNFADKHKFSFKSSKREFLYSEGTLRSSDFFLIKPTTFMNLSGTAVLDFVLDNSIDVKEILVIVDDVNLSLGKIRLRKSGSDGGHNGLKSIIYSLQDNSFPRLRFGVGSQFQKGELSGYVLDKFSKSELDTIYESLGFSQELIYEFIIGGYNSMLNFFSKQNKIKKSQQQESLE